MIELESPAHDASPARTDQLLAALATQATIGNERETATAAALARVDARLEAMEKTIAPLVVDARGRAMFGARVFALLEKIKLQQAIAIAILGATVATVGGLSLALVMLAIREPAAVLAFVVTLFSHVPG
jgi:hypothetical protein